MVANSSRESALEQSVRQALFARGLRFRKQVRLVPGLRCTVDIAFPGTRIAVFIDGCFWHRCPLHATDPVSNGAWWRQKLEANVTRDRRNDDALRAAGWTVLRYWEHEPVETITSAIEAAVTAEKTRR
jgi:DNA mismatch endonuclease, patch repair protein